jgi:RHS repeat-associated protein
LLNNLAEQYTYDAIYQLTQVVQGTTTTESYSYDAVGNRLSSLGMSPYAYNSSNQLMSTPAATFTYDGNGNTLTKTDSTGATQYTWDFENRLSSVVLPGAAGTVTFKYDPFGRRVQKISASGTTNYLYDGSNSVEEVDPSGVLLARYAQGAGIDEPLAELRGGTTALYEQDGLGSVTSLSGSAGAIANTYAYDSFGVLTASTGTLGNPFQYTGRDYDSETGLRYYRARYYDSAAGRFLSEDPTLFFGGINFYDYVNNSVTGLIDPSGLSGSRPGGPYHPPNGVHTACLPFDNCKTVIAKMWLLTRMINSHTGWDQNMPFPQGGNRHSISPLGNLGEIPQLWMQYAVCQNLFFKVCGNQCPKPNLVPARKRTDSYAPVDIKPVIITVGTGYIIYRAVRMLPSLAPPLWWTIPENAVIP